MGSNIQEGRERGCPRPSVASIIYTVYNSYMFQRITHARSSVGTIGITFPTTVVMRSVLQWLVP